MAAGDVVPLPAQAFRRDRQATGFLLATLTFESLYANDAAIQILSYPQVPAPQTSWRILAQARIRSILNVDRFDSDMSAVPFVSGRRRYVCRPFLLQSSDRAGMVAILLERPSREPLDVSEISRRFHLSPREGETVLYLIRGLSTKQVAHRMSVSPNTVKQFVRLTMSKMGVSTRVGIVSKILTGLFLTE